MAHFRAVIKGARGEASRLGHKRTGMYARVQTWGWDVVVDARHNEASDQDWAEVELVHHTTGQRIAVLDLNLTTGKAFARAATVPSGVPYHRPKTGQPCSCRRGIERDNCPQCEGTGQRIDFAAIRNARKGD